MFVKIIFLTGGVFMPINNNGQQEQPPIKMDNNGNFNIHGSNQSFTEREKVQYQRDLKGNTKTPDIQNNADVPEVIKAIQTAKAAKEYFSVGNAWLWKNPAGEGEIKIGIVFRNMAVACLKFNPLTGEVLPLGFNPHVYSSNIDPASLKQKASEIIANSIILDGAEFREPERCWVVPLSYEGKIIAHIKVYQDGISIVPDYPLNQEMAAYGR